MAFPLGLQAFKKVSFARLQKVLELQANRLLVENHQVVST